jgi:cytidylate kinase
MSFVKKYSVHIIWAVVVIVAFGGGAWWGKSSAANQVASRETFTTSTRTGGLGRATGGGFVSGQIISADSNSLTVALANGNSQVVFYSSSTQVMKPTIVPASNLTAGTRVMIGGTENSDGSLTAQSIQVQIGNASGTRGFGVGQ